MQYSEENTVPVHIVVLASVMFVGYALRNYLISAFANFVTEHRGIFVTIFVLPISVLFDVFWYTRNKIVHLIYSAPERHNARVKDIQDQVRRCKGTGTKKQEMMCTGRPGWLAMSPKEGRYKRTMKRINVDLYDILDIDTKKRIVRVEPLVTTGQLTQALLPLGWTLPVVPELDDLTVGGLIMGFGVETSSHRYGLFQYTAVAHEIVLPDGRLVRCSEDENPELFHAIPWSHGTLGFLVASELKIIPAKQYVHLQYRPVFSKSELLKVFEQESREINNDFVECLMYTDDQGVVMVGKMTDDVEHRKINRIGRYWKPWFYKHVEGFLRDGPAEEYIPIREYYHRHTKSLFWELAEIIPFGNNPIYRYIYGWMIPPKISLLKLTQTKALRRLYDLHHVVQDMLVPINKLGEALDVFKREFNIYPLWICPMKLFSHPKYRGLVNPVPDEDLYVDIGGYGSPKAPTFVARESLRRVEKYVRDVGGFQALYADTYMTREEFREMFDHRLYDELRKAYDCEGALPEIYDKISKDARRYE